ncbi:MAG: hypothetical protein ABSC42_04740 [Tepidisphaeraceae bacterium]
MLSKQTYEIEWSGITSNAFASICGLLLIIGFVLASYTIIRGIVDLVKRRSPAGLWEWVTFIVFVWLILILSAVRGLLAARAGGSGSVLIGTSGSGVLSGFSRSALTRPGRWLAISILAAPAFACVFVTSLLREGPLGLAISSDQIELIYRLPWRDKSIRMSDVTDVHLDRHDFMDRAFHNYFYILEICHDGELTVVHCNHRSWYEGQLKAAYSAIQTSLKARESGPEELKIPTTLTAT